MFLRIDWISLWDSFLGWVPVKHLGFFYLVYLLKGGVELALVRILGAEVTKPMKPEMTTFWRVNTSSSHSTLKHGALTLGAVCLFVRASHLDGWPGAEECVWGVLGKVELASGWRKLDLRKGDWGIILPGGVERSNLYTQEYRNRTRIPGHVKEEQVKTKSR